MMGLTFQHMMEFHKCSMKLVFMFVVSFAVKPVMDYSFLRQFDALISEMHSWQLLSFSCWVRVVMGT